MQPDKFLRICLLAAVTAAIAAPARAQIYTWRDEQGNLVLSDSKPAPHADLRTFAVP